MRPGGRVALVWNSRDAERPIQREIGDLIAAFVPRNRPPAESWPDPLAESEPFGPLEERRFPFAQELDADQLAERIASVSFVAAAPAEARRRLDSELREVVARLGGRVTVPYVSVVYVSRAV